MTFCIYKFHNHSFFHSVSKQFNSVKWTKRNTQTRKGSNNRSELCCPPSLKPGERRISDVMHLDFHLVQGPAEPDMRMSSQPLKQRCPWPSFGSDMSFPDPSPQVLAQEQGTAEGVSPCQGSVMVRQQQQKEVQCTTWPSTPVCLFFLQNSQVHCHGISHGREEGSGRGGPGTAIRSQAEGEGRRASHVSGFNQRFMNGHPGWQRERHGPWLCSPIRLIVLETEELYLVG